jgi:hypothetical protein
MHLGAEIRSNLQFLMHFLPAHFIHFIQTSLFTRQDDPYLLLAAAFFLTGHARKWL